MNCRDQDKHIISLRHTFEAGSPAVVEMQNCPESTWAEPGWTDVVEKQYTNLLNHRFFVVMSSLLRLPGSGNFTKSLLSAKKVSKTLTKTLQ